MPALSTALRAQHSLPAVHCVCCRFEHFRLRRKLGDLLPGAGGVCDEGRRWDGARCTLVAQIHDELLFEVDDDDATDAIRVVKRCMERAIELSVPTPVKVSTGKSWGELIHVE